MSPSWALYLVGALSTLSVTEARLGATLGISGDGFNATAEGPSIEGSGFGVTGHSHQAVVSSCTSTRMVTIKWQLYMKLTSRDRYIVPCGTILRFDWAGEYHGVALVPSFACPAKPSDYKTIPGGAVSPINTVAYYKTTRPGTLYFACQVAGHCQSGQIIRVDVQ